MYPNPPPERGGPRSRQRAEARERAAARRARRAGGEAGPPMAAQPVSGGRSPAGPTSGAQAPGRPVSGPPPVASPPAESPPVPAVPVRRLQSLAIALFALVLTVGLIFAAQTAGIGIARLPYAIVIFGVQTLLVLSFTMALRPPGVKVVALVGLASAAAANAAAILPQQATVAPLGYVAAAGFVVGVVGQLLRREGRIRVTESLGATLVVVIGVVSFATLVVLTRQPIGTQAITVCLAATGVALTLARLIDTIAPWPRLAPQVPRGSIGVVAGAMAGTGVAAVLGGYLQGFTPTNAAMVGVVTAVGAVMADLSVGYAEAGRRTDGELPTMWIARHLQGPLAGFALAAPLAYLMSVVFFVHRY